MAYFTGTASDHKDLLEEIRTHATTANSVSAPVAGGGNVGGGTVSQPTASDASPTETWTLTCTSTALDNGIFSVVGSVSGTQSPATVGLAYDSPLVDFLISDGAPDFELGDSFTFNVTQLMGIQRWEEEYYSTTEGTTGSEKALILKGVGYAGSDTLYIGYRTYTDTGAGQYGMEFEGYTGYTGGDTFETAPGSLTTAGKLPPIMQLANASFNYKLYINGRRIICTCVPAVGRPNCNYSGWLLPYSSPSTLPYPLFVGGSSAGDDRTPGTDDNSFFGSNRQQGTSFYKLSGWEDYYRYSVWPWDLYDFSTDDNFIRNSAPDLSGDYDLLRSSVGHMTDGIKGTFDGVFWISEFSNNSGNTVTIGGDTYDVHKDGSVEQYCAILQA